MGNKIYQFHGISKVVALQLFLISAAALAFEINLTRIFSIIQFYHFAFLIVSLALLGFGMSGTALSIFPILGNRPERTLFWSSFGVWASILVAYLAINWIPFDSYILTWDFNQLIFFAIQYFCLAIPFYFNGLAVGVLLNSYAQIAGKVYAWNLSGAAVGCLFALIAPGLFGGVGTILVITCLPAVATLLPVSSQVDRTTSFVVRGLSVVLIVFAILQIFLLPSDTKISGLIDLRLSPYKSLSYALQFPGAKIISEKWNAISRVEVVESTGIRSLPGISLRYFNPPPQELGLFIDGDNLNPIVLPGEDLSFSGYMPLALPFQLRQQAKTLILEPRGGLDILIAHNEGARSITAVEANDLVVNEAGTIYQIPGVNVHIDSSRSFLRGTEEKFDIIVLSLTDAYHPVRSGAYSLGEDYSYTLESIQDALKSLSPNGILVITRWLQMPPSEWLRAFVLAATALETTGRDPAENIVAMRSFNTGMLLIKNTPFTPEELEISRNFASEKGFDLVYQSGIKAEETNRFAVLEEPIYFQKFTAFLSAPSQAQWISAYPYDVSPPTDDHPFYGHYFKWSQTQQILSELGKTWQPFGGAGYLIVLLMLALACIFAFFLILLPLFLRRNQFSGKGATAPSRKIMLFAAGYFGMIGLAFMFVEVPLIQQFILYLGHPAYSLTTILFYILLFSAVGSVLSGYTNIRFILPGLVGVLVLMRFVLPWIFANTLEFSFFVRIVFTGIIVAPAGIMMGMPLPGGIRMFEGDSQRLVAWVWGINGFASVIASILAMLIALTFGFSWVLIVGAVCYVCAWLLIVPLRSWI